MAPEPRTPAPRSETGATETTTAPAGRPASARTIATEGAVKVTLRRRRPDWWGIAFQVGLLLAVLVSLAFLVMLVADSLIDGWPVFTDRGTDFLTQGLSSDPEQAGVWQGLTGSLQLALIVGVVAFPLGIATAVYLEEYVGSKNRLSRFIDLNIRNLAGVPSVVYGLLGLTVFVQWFGINRSAGGGFTGGRSVIAGGLTLSILVLPIVIITTAEALRAVPWSIREAGYGVGATRWEVTKQLVLPAASPGILTGTVLALARALGETAPLLIIGAVAGGGGFSTGNQSVWESFRGSFTALPMVSFGWARLPNEEFRALTSASIIVLLAVTLLFNSIAIALRYRYEQEW